MSDVSQTGIAVKLSIVTTLYKSQSFIAELHARVTKVARDLVGDDYEIVVVNDGSPDQSLDAALTLARTDPHMVVVDLSRNFGHHKALMTGLDHSQGAFVALLDSDLEEAPEDLIVLAQDLRTNRCDVAFGVQHSRKGGVFEKASGASFYWLFEKLTGSALPRNLMTMRLMTRRYVDALLRHRERDMVIANLWQMTGFDQRPVILHKASQSKTNYSIWRKLSLMVTAVTAVSSRPLLGVFYIGVSLFLVSLAYVVWLVLVWMLHSQVPGGWTSLIVSVWMLGGLTLCAIGILGIYLAKIFIEVKQRPYALVRAVFRGDAEGDLPDYEVFAALQRPSSPLVETRSQRPSHE
ncbi:putative glycosyltransferase [Jannaschia faecimaris]|uniref:Putative glycosyltransferase n=1 Tax=Jannaschia faecimaris TaxID=1244108 RepID=A0A1H3JP62_9RHOB|nr:glycosyltransferase family 2 protein [Jannaschia faecimaris]SDY41706.1 putative glycosyltransferase [Jannaschia faecimaris]